MKVLLDNVDITADLNKQYPLPQSVTVGGIFPDTSGSRWWDLAKCIAAHPQLAGYFNGGVHVMQIIDNGQAFKVKMLLRAKYTSRNA